MQLRPELNPPVSDVHAVSKLSQLAEEVVYAGSNTARSHELLDELNRHLPRPLSYADIVAAGQGDGVPERIAQELYGRPPVLDDISDAEFMEIMVRLSTGGFSPNAASWYLKLLEINLSCPHIGEYIFQQGLSPAEVLAKSRQYKPFAF